MSPGRGAPSRTLSPSRCENPWVSHREFGTTSPPPPRHSDQDWRYHGTRAICLGGSVRPMPRPGRTQRRDDSSFATVPLKFPPSFVIVGLKDVEELKKLAQTLGSPTLEWIGREGPHFRRHRVVIDAPRQMVYEVVEDTFELDDDTLGSLIRKAEELISVSKRGAGSDTLWDKVNKLLSPFGSSVRANLIPSEPGGACQRVLIVIPELLAPLWQRLRNANAQDPCIQIEAGPVGDDRNQDGTICCALCRAWRHVQHCHSEKEGWANSIIYVFGNEAVITSQGATQSERCFKEREVADDIIDFNAGRRYTCWDLFVKALSGLTESTGGSSGRPALFLNEKRIL